MAHATAFFNRETTHFNGCSFFILNSDYKTLQQYMDSICSKLYTNQNSETLLHQWYQKSYTAACRLFLRNLPGHPSPRQGQKQATSMPPAALAVLVPLDFDPPSGLKIYAPQ